tara:strand:+ start:474 stop:926 length:453 start_codon:yes stop_codon:yes gene_type:complete
MYIKITNGSIDQFPYTVGKLRRDNKNVSFPKQVSASDMAEFGMYPVTTLDEPSYNIRTEVLSQNSEPTLVSEVWTLGFTVSNKSTDDIAAYDLQAAAIAREERDTLLAATDFYALSDVVMTSDMTTYRSDLRAVPAQSEFPTTISWPTAP